MSIEKAIEDNTAALVALTKVLTAGLSAPATGKKPKAEKPAETNSPTVTTGITGVAATQQPTAAPAAPKGPTLKQVTDLVLDFAATENAKAKAILKEFGVQKIPQLKPEQFDAVIAAVQKAKDEIAAEIANGNDDDTSLV
jgi:hypothetical protein